MPKEQATRYDYWIFSNSREGHYDNSDWDTATIVKRKRYYFQLTEKNRAKIKTGDVVILRTYSDGYWGECKIEGEWIPDPEGETKYKIKTGWFPITNLKKWKTILPFEIISSELSNKNYRIRIAKATKEDRDKLELAVKIYLNLGYGHPDSNFFILENGLEEGVKKNLSQLKLKLAEESMRQQCVLGIGIGRTDLICKDEKGNYVVLELKIGKASDNVVGQILRYMGYIREKWAVKENKEVKGIILTPDYDEQLRLAANEAGVKVLRTVIR